MNLKREIYHEVNKLADAVKHAQRTVFVLLQEKVKCKLEELETRDIIEKVTEPTDWISLMVI